MSERRTDRFLDKSRNQGLTPFLAEGPGRGLGPDDRAVRPGRDRLRAQAARRPGLGRLDPVLGDARGPRLDGVGRGPQRLRRSVDGLGRVLAIEVLTAARGIARQAPLLPGPATGAVVRLVESVAGGTGPDRYLSPQIEAVVDAVQTGAVRAAVESVTGPWHEPVSLGSRPPRPTHEGRPTERRCG